MNIEKEIKQEKFKTPLQKAMVNVLFTGNWLTNNHSRFLKPYGITTQQYNVLRILKGQYPTPLGVNCLIGRMLDKNSNASRLIDKLQTKGLVKRSACNNDRRKVDVVITKTGVDLINEIISVSEKKESQLINLTEKEATQLSDLLDKMRDIKKNNFKKK